MRILKWTQLLLAFQVYVFFSCQTDTDSTQNTNDTVNSEDTVSTVNEIEQVVEGEPVIEQTKMNQLVIVQESTMECDLPEPSEAFLNMKAEDPLFMSVTGVQEGYIYDDVYYYLLMTLDSMETKQVLKEDKDWGVVEWAQEFDCGVMYIHEDIPEAGSETRLYTKTKNKTVFLKAIEPVIRFIPCENCYDYNPVWKNDSTTYEPADGGAGCYYSIENDSLGYLMMSWYCGC